MSNKLPDSAASVAGYEYQFVWATWRCLKLLEANSKSTQVVIESIYGPDILTLAAEDEDLLVVDVSEYEGGYDIKTADRIIVSQLKYSPTSPDKNWTINGLCTGRNNNDSRSIIGGLALVFKRFIAQTKKPEKLTSKLCLRLVTNRPIQPAARKSIEKAIELLKARTSKSAATSSWLLKQNGLSDKDVKHLEELYTTTGLKSTQFPIFLQCLSLSGFNQDNLDGLEVLAKKVMVSVGAQGRNDLFLELCSRVRKAAIEQSTKPFTKDDVLTHFFSDVKHVLPSPCKIRKPDTLIETRDLQKLGACISNCSANQLLVHGTAGKGKSITTSHVVSQLATGSRAIVYDCYGMGMHEGISTGYRHQSERFCNQVINEIAINENTGLFYIPSQHSRKDRWEMLKEALLRVSNQLHSDQLFLLIVDAADNARDNYEACSDYDKEDLFLEELWKLPLPDNVRLIVTCRTNRKGDICAPSNIAEFEIAGFIPTETELHLERNLGALSKEVCEHFHEASHWTPRLQDYWISDLKGIDSAGWESAILAKASYGIEEEYFSWVTSASNGLPLKVSGESCIAVLRSLRQPFSIEEVAGALELTEEQAGNFCIGLQQGLVFTEDDTLEFRDQDFEAALESRLTPEMRITAHDCISTWCLCSLEQSCYAARNIGFHLDRAERHSDLIEQALSLSHVDILEEPDLRESCASECVQLAFKSCKITGDYASPLQLIFNMARLARTREAGNWMLMEYPEICIRFGLHASVRKVLLDSDSTNGPLHYRIAASLAEIGDTETAEQHLAEGEAWLKKYIDEQGEQHYLNHSFELENSIDRGVAYTLLEDFSEGAHRAMCWTSKVMRVSAINRLVMRLASGPMANTFNMMPEKEADPVFMAAMLGGEFSSYRIPAGKIVKESISSVIKKSKLWKTEFNSIEPWMIDFTELCLRRKVDENIVRRFLQQYPLPAQQIPRFHASRAFWESESHEYIQALALLHELTGEELTVEKLIPKEKESSGYDYEYERVSSTTRRLLPAYKIRARALHKSWNISRAWREVEKGLSDWEPSPYREEGKYVPFFRTYAVHVVDSLMLLPGGHHDFVNVLVEKAEQLLYPPDFADFCMDVAEICCHRPEFRGDAQELAAKTVELTELYPRKARERCTLLLRASSLLMDSDSELSESIFQKALQASHDVDEDAPVLASALGRTAYAVGVRNASSFPDLAQRLWKASNALELCSEDERGIDWSITQRGIAALDGNYGYAAMMDLDRTNYLALTESLPSFLCGMHTSLASRDSACLAGMMVPLCAVTSTNLECQAMMLAQMPAGQFAKDAFETLSRLVLLDSSYSKRSEMCQKLLDLAKELRIGAGGTQRLEESCDFYGEDLNWQRSSHSRHYDSDAEKYKKFKSLRRRLEKGSFDSDPKKALNAILGSGIYTNDLRVILVDLGRRMRGQNVSRYLDGLCDFDGDGYYTHEGMISGVIIELIATLSPTLILKKWISRRYASYVVEVFPALISYNSSYKQAARPLLESDAVEVAEREKAVLDILCEYGHRLSSRRLYELAGTYSVISRTSSPEKVLKHELDQLPDAGEELRCESIPTGVNQLASKIIYDVYGHEDNRLRWRALHVFRLAVKNDSDPFVSAFVDRMLKEKSLLWMSAREWGLFSLFWLSREHVSLLTSHGNEIWTIASDVDFQHATHQELAKGILLNVLEHDQSVLTDEQRQELMRLNKPSASLLDRKFATSVGQQHDLRFSFDSMDTMPYWYSRLGNAFGLHRCDVAVRAEKWVCDSWEITREQCREIDERTRKYDWNLKSNRHGERPTVESYSRYIEWHAMMMAAGEMIRALPVQVEHYSDGNEDQWSDWLGRRAYLGDPSILSDLRTPLPLDPIVHGTCLEDKAVSRPLDEGDYRGAVSLSNDCLAIAGSYTAKASGVSWSWTISTALVSPKMGSSLAVAILKAPYPYAIDIPSYELKRLDNCEGGYTDALATNSFNSDQPVAIDSGDFRLYPWVVSCYSEEELGDRDPIWRGSGRNWKILSSEVVNELKLKPDKFRTSYSDVQNLEVARCDVWTDGADDNEHRDRDYSYGNRLIMQKRFIREYLKSKKMDLIVRVTISRYAEGRFRDEKDKFKDEAGVFIYRQNGRLEFKGLRATPHQDPY